MTPVVIRALFSICTSISRPVYFNSKANSFNPTSTGNTMQNFDFQNPTHIVFGKNRIADLDKLVPAAAKVLILVGGTSAEENRHAERSASSPRRTHARHL